MKWIDRKIFGLFIGLCIIGCFLGQEELFSQEDSPSQRIVKYVDIIKNKTVSSAKILSRLKTKRGEPFSEKVVNEDVKRLYLMGFFSDVSVTIAEQEDGVGIIFEVKEYPILKAIKFAGNRIYRERKLRDIVKAKLDEFADEKKLKKDALEIEELYKRSGYPWVQVIVQMDVHEVQNEATAIFKVDEGSKAVVRRITFIGNTAFSDKRISKVIKARTSGLFRSGLYKKDVLDDDMERLKAFYRKEGFLDAGANYETISKDRGKKRWIEVLIRVEEGKKYVFGGSKLVGNTVFSEGELKRLCGMRSGDTFTEVNLHEDVSAIQEYYFDRGYIMAKVRPDTFLNPETDKVDVTYNIIEGEICYVNKVNIKGNTKTKDVVIRRELKLHPGERYDGDELRRSKERLYNLGFFEDITFDIEDTDISNKKDMVVEVKEAKTGEFSFGGGFSSIDRLLGFVEIEQKNFDILNFPTFTGDGQDLKMRGEFGSARKYYVLSWTEPWIFDFPISFGFDLYSTEKDRSGSTGYVYDEKRKGGAIRLGKELSEYLRADFTYRGEQVDISDLSSDASQELLDEVGKKSIRSVFFQLTRDTRDNIFNSTKGTLLSGSIEVAGGAIGGDRDFMKFFNTINHYTPIGLCVLEESLRQGIVSSFGDTGKVPIYERFFSGGTYTIRGYKERGVGPKDQSGDSVGGGTIAVGNLELTFPIIENFKGAFFIDAGNVWRVPDSKPEGGNSTLGVKIGAGTGVRIKTPIGPVKLDFGFPINPEENQDDTGRFHFSMSRGF